MIVDLAQEAVGRRDVDRADAAMSTGPSMISFVFRTGRVSSSAST